MKYVFQSKRPHHKPTYFLAILLVLKSKNRHGILAGFTPQRQPSLSGVRDVKKHNTENFTDSFSQFMYT